jgi:hypothetical protein
MKFISLLFVSAAAAFAGGFSGVFDAGWSTAYQRPDSLTKMHARLHSLGMPEVILQYGIVDGMHRYYDSELPFGASGTTTYNNYHLFDYSLAAAKAAGNHLWLGLYYNGTDWYTPPTMAELDTLAARNVKVIDELYTLYGTDDVIRGVYIPQEIARYYWDGLRGDATAASLVEHFLKPVTAAAQAKGWKVMAAPFYNANLETLAVLQGFFENLFKAGWIPDVIAVQDGIGAADNGKAHVTLADLGIYLRAVKAACDEYGVKFWVDTEMFATGASGTLADEARLYAQADTAWNVGAVNVVGYDLAVLGNAGLDSLEIWQTAHKTTAVAPPARLRVQRKSTVPLHYWNLNGARVPHPER